MTTSLADLYQDWIVCENYEVLEKFEICKALDSVGEYFQKLGISYFIDQYAFPSVVLFFFAFICISLFKSLTVKNLVYISKNFICFYN